MSERAFRSSLLVPSAVRSFRRISLPPSARPRVVIIDQTGNAELVGPVGSYVRNRENSGTVFPVAFRPYDQREYTANPGVLLELKLFLRVS